MLKKCLILLLPILSLYGKTPKYDPQIIPNTSPSTEFVAKDFSHLLGHLKGIDDDLLKMHFTLYNGYVKNASALLTELVNMRKKGDDRSLRIWGT